MEPMTVQKNRKMLSEARRNLYDAINMLQRSGFAIDFAGELRTLKIIEDRIWQEVTPEKRKAL